jgi:hypothetical protein
MSAENTRETTSHLLWARLRAVCGTPQTRLEIGTWRNCSWRTAYPVRVHQVGDGSPLRQELGVAQDLEMYIWILAIPPQHLCPSPMCVSRGIDGLTLPFLLSIYVEYMCLVAWLICVLRSPHLPVNPHLHGTPNCVAQFANVSTYIAQYLCVVWHPVMLKVARGVPPVKPDLANPPWHCHCL